MAYGAILDIESLSIGSVSAMKSFGDRVLSFGNGDIVNVVAHQTIGPDAQQKSAAAFSKQFDVFQPVGVIPEYIESAASALSNMVRHSDHDGACSSWHVR